MGLSILELSKIVMQKFWYDMDKDCFIVYLKTDDIYKEIAQDVETRFDTSDYELDRPLPKGKKLKGYWFNER